MSLDSVLVSARIPGHPNVSALGCWERSVSIYLQQVRALNLAYALHQTQVGQRLLVIGGGFAGMTAAAALHCLGHTVTLAERQPRLLHWQRGNRVRYIHPHIHEWPRPGSEDPDAGLPLLNWHAALAGEVAEEVVRQFEPMGVAVQFGVDAAPMTDFDHVILALGLGVERSFGKLPLNSYWTDDSVSTVRDGPPRRYLVSGTGEGGVIDTLYLVLRDFSHWRMARDILGTRDLDPLKSMLLQLEGTENLTQAYEALPVPSHVDEALGKLLRSDTLVTINGSTAGYLSAKADILSRFLLSRLVHLGAVRYVQGKLSEIAVSDNGYDVLLDTGLKEHVDRVLVRHGTVPSMQVHFPVLWDAYIHERRTQPSTPDAPIWPNDFAW